MSTLTATERLTAIQRSLEAAREASFTKAHQSIEMSEEYQKRYEHHMRGMSSGLQVAINLIALELRLIEAGQQEVAQ